MSKLNVADQMVVKRWVGESEDWLRNVGTRSLDWNVIVFFEIDTSLLLGWVILDTEEFALFTWVGRTSDVLAITELTSSTTTSWSRTMITTTATTSVSAWVAICITVKSWTIVIPTCSWRAVSWLKVRSICPITLRARTIESAAVRYVSRLVISISCYYAHPGPQALPFIGGGPPFIFGGPPGAPRMCGGM
jgi:hypothetical protein